MSDANSRQVAGNHYKTEFQHWDMLVCQDIGLGPEYFIGQITKYMSRWHKKNGLRDVLKAQHFAEKLLELVREDGLRMPYHTYNDAALQMIIPKIVDRTLNHYFAANGIERESATIIIGVLFASDGAALAGAVEAIKALAVRMQSNVDVEPPVAAGFEFVRYGEDSATITWRSKTTGVERTLAVDQPPDDF